MQFRREEKERMQIKTKRALLSLKNANGAPAKCSIGLTRHATARLITLIVSALIA